MGRKSEMTSRQTALMIKIRSVIADIGESCGESSSLHLKAREFANELEWYLANRVLEEAQ